jgi:hypothetical protein
MCVFDNGVIIRCTKTFYRPAYIKSLHPVVVVTKTFKKPTSEITALTNARDLSLH